MTSSPGLRARTLSIGLAVLLVGATACGANQPRAHSKATPGPSTSSLGNWSVVKDPADGVTFWLPNPTEPRLDHGPNPTHPTVRYYYDQFGYLGLSAFVGWLAHPENELGRVKRIIAAQQTRARKHEGSRFRTTIHRVTVASGDAFDVTLTWVYPGGYTSFSDLRVIIRSTLLVDVEATGVEYPHPINERFGDLHAKQTTEDAFKRMAAGVVLS